MATVTRSLATPPAVASAQGRPVSSVRFDGSMMAVCCWLIGGVFLDTWAHSTLAVLDTFFTPWHAVLYSGATAVAAFIFGPIVWYHRRGYAWRQAVPVGYELSLVGIVLLGLSGVGDMLWHLAFGIERNTDAILSPTHLGLAFAIALVVGGPLRAAWQRPDSARPGSWATQLPMLVSFSFTLIMVTLLTLYGSPFHNTQVAEPIQTEMGQQLAVTSILLYTAILMGFLLTAVRRWPALPFGALAFVLALETLLVSATNIDSALPPVLLLTGVIAEGLRWALHPSATRVGAFRVFAVAVPAALFALYFGALYLTAGIHWSIHLWLGCVVSAAIAGWLISLLVVPPVGAGEARRADDLTPQPPSLRRKRELDRR
ncbi:MAG: hypothetical protein M3Z04_21655 [Chloroflexota bacterium]|nr:hypothetical protein [Chloroflexota bacterium]